MVTLRTCIYRVSCCSLIVYSCRNQLICRSCRYSVCCFCYRVLAIFQSINLIRSTTELWIVYGLAISVRSSNSERNRSKVRCICTCQCLLDLYYACRCCCVLIYQCDRFTSSCKINIFYTCYISACRYGISVYSYSGRILFNSICAYREITECSAASGLNFEILFLWIKCLLICLQIEIVTILYCNIECSCNVSTSIVCCLLFNNKISGLIRISKWNNIRIIYLILITNTEACLIISFAICCNIGRTWHARNNIFYFFNCITSNSVIVLLFNHVLLRSICGILCLENIFAWTCTGFFKVFSKQISRY